MAKPYPQSKIVQVLSIKDFENNDIWVMKNGDAVYIKDLRKSHIISILELMNSKIWWRHELKPVLQNELRRRKELSLIKKGKAGKILYAKT